MLPMGAHRISDFLSRIPHKNRSIFPCDLRALRSVCPVHDACPAAHSNALR